jgi:hypothetical protein
MVGTNSVEDFIAHWRKTGGSELANTQSFINGLCALIGVPAPHGSRSDDAFNDYVFERRVFQDNGDGSTSFGRIDAYRKGSFILEAKQGSEADKAAADGGISDIDFFGQTAAARMKRGSARRGTPGWAKAMVQAKGQAERYAKALPVDHGWPPFLLVADIGYCIEVYADFTGTGKAYAQFPDRASFRIMLDDLRDADVRARLAAIWTNPKSLDPAAIAAKATRDIADLLAKLARRLEARGHGAEQVSAFLMRLLFTMFAEDTRLIPAGSFSELLVRTRPAPEALHHQLSALWEAMDGGGFAPALGATLRRFNGYLFKDRSAIPLQADELDVLIEAAKADWTQVEPAIFGTLLERALDTKERAKLGAHYTPRAYVERLVMPTVIEPLRADWAGVRGAATQLLEAGKTEDARKTVEAFHAQLAGTKVLDPACGTGNFLYVAMARMKELEGEVIELLTELGDTQYVAELSGHTITPENFLGIEINPRAAAIAQLVLWIGYLQWHFRVAGKDRMPAEPILKDIRTIENRDALITWDDKVLERDENGVPVSIWDGTTMKRHPVTDALVPDDTGRMEVYRYINPRQTKWPKADFIIGNPPFIGNKRMRARLGDGYTEAVRQAYSDTPETVDFVMYWWEVAAAAAAMGVTRRFGFITTNSITSPFNNIVISAAKSRLLFAIPDHPWVDGTDGADVRIAMTCGGMEAGTAFVETVLSETELPDGFGERGVSLHRQPAEALNADLTIGVDVRGAETLGANQDIAVQGVVPLGMGFRLDEDALAKLGFDEKALPTCLKQYVIGRDLVQRPERKWVIDFFGLDAKQASIAEPALFQHLHTTVKPERDQNRRATRRDNWWLFGENAPALRQASKGLSRVITTCRTAKHRIFVFVPAEYILDTKIIGIALDDAFFAGILTSKIHQVWAFRIGGWLGVGNDSTYNHTDCFGKFPFPADVPEPLKDRIRAEAEALDALRKRVLAAHDDLTLTGLYNVLELLRAGTPLSDKDRDVHDRGLVTIIRQHHDALDALVAQAYGWGADHAAGTLTDAEILTRLVALNAARAAEEARGIIRWLRPDYQAPNEAPKTTGNLDLGEAPALPATATIIPWPKTLPEQVSAVAGLLQGAAAPLHPRDVARAFKAKQASSMTPVLDTLTAIGMARKLADGRYAA